VRFFASALLQAALHDAAHSVFFNERIEMNVSARGHRPECEIGVAGLWCVQYQLQNGVKAAK
jgi:hypothetical protein